MQRRCISALIRPSRRALLAGAPAALGAALLSRAAETVVVATSFPEELTTHYEVEFEKAHPGLHVQFVWKQSRDALALLSQPEQGGVDVYWAPSLGNFPILRDHGAFRPLPVDRAVLPGRLGAQPISDSKGMFEAYDLAGYGIVYDPAALAVLGLAAPRRWSDLAAPAFAGRVVIPLAGKVGFSPALYDIILQAEGWERGWSLLCEIAGGAELASSGPGPTGAVREGRAALGLTIDFLALGAQANGAKIGFAYPERTAFLPGHIAITTATRRPEAARAFVDFALSTKGQRLLMEADSSRHPARPDAYAGHAERIVDPFSLPPDSFFAYDAEIGRRRPSLVSVLFGLAIAERHAETVALWRALHAAEARLAAAPEAGAAEIAAKARRLAGFVPLSIAEASDPALLDRFSGRELKDPELAARWRAEIGAARAEATRLLASLDARL
ncbi:ABC transporter substrate-binding protein [Methylosinus sp. Sm6]|uniref:ABC transporter substrate-binding protein n=1 Tax=Methylosinus sp. Sm6 TaxID=2866948 RepID=UPI001C99F2E6|nr:extracellular solute-binding protein [Methylosinus sp. Sm6]MBY6242731.1 extracellular solute-binding protein [Methylosinus sp. Sm6]